MSGALRIAKNANALLLAEAMNVCSGIVTVVAIARLMNPESLGLFSFSFALGSVLSISAYYGINTLVVREVSRRPEKMEEYLGNVLAVRGAISLALLAGMEIALVWAGFSGRRLMTASLLVGFRVLESLTLTVCSFFRARQDMAKELVLRSIINVLGLSAGLWALYHLRSLFAYSLVQCCLGLAGLLLASSFLAGGRAARVAGAVSYGRMKSLAREGLHFSFFAALLVLYVQTNTVLLGLIKGEYDTGLYTAAFRFVSAFGMMASGVTSAVFPALSRLDRRDPAQLAEFTATYLRSAKYLLAMGTFISLALFAFAPQLIRLFYGGAFEPAVKALKIMSFSVALLFLNSSLSGLMFSLDRESASVGILAALVAFVFLINTALLPRFGYMGAALTTLLPEVFYGAVQLAFLKRHFSLPLGSLLLKFLALGLAVAAGFACFPESALPLRAAALAALYAAGLCLFKLLGPEEIGFLSGKKEALGNA